MTLFPVKMVTTVVVPSCCRMVYAALIASIAWTAQMQRNLFSENVLLATSCMPLVLWLVPTLHSIQMRWTCWQKCITTTETVERVLQHLLSIADVQSSHRFAVYWERPCESGRNLSQDAPLEQSLEGHHRKHSSFLCQFSAGYWLFLLASFTPELRRSS